MMFGLHETAFVEIGREIFGSFRRVGSRKEDAVRRSGQAEPVGKAAQIIGAARDAFFEQGYGLFDPSFNPSKAAKTRQVKPAVGCFLARYGVTGNEQLPT